MTPKERGDFKYAVDRDRDRLAGMAQASHMTRVDQYFNDRLELLRKRRKDAIARAAREVLRCD